MGREETAGWQGNNLTPSLPTPPLPSDSLGHLWGEESCHPFPAGGGPCRGTTRPDLPLTHPWLLDFLKGRDMNSWATSRGAAVSPVCCLIKEQGHCVPGPDLPTSWMSNWDNQGTRKWPQCHHCVFTPEPKAPGPGGSRQGRLRAHQSPQHKGKAWATAPWGCSHAGPQRPTGQCPACEQQSSLSALDGRQGACPSAQQASRLGGSPGLGAWDLPVVTCGRLLS